MDVNKIICGDCTEKLKQFPDESIDLIVTDPPYGLTNLNPMDLIDDENIKSKGFMGKEWDNLPSVDIWNECLRVLKPGAFAFVMAIPRQDALMLMQYRLAKSGFNINFTSLYHVFSSGFPKSYNIAKGVEGKLKLGTANWSEWDKLDGEKGVDNLGYHKSQYEQGYRDENYQGRVRTVKVDLTTPEAKSLDGSYAGFQPKPATEIIIQAQKPVDKYSVLTITTSYTLKLINEILQCINVDIVESSLLQNSILEEYTAQRSAMGSIIEEAKVNIGRVAKHYGLMDMLISILEEMETKQDIILNIELLWKSILVDLLGKTNKFTIEMVNEQIIELKTLNLLLVQSIQESIIIQKKTQQNGVMLNVKIVESILENVLINLLSLNRTSVNTNVFSNLCMKNQDISVNGAKKNLEQIIQKENTVLNNVTTKVVIVAMKPLSEKTFVDQALKNKKGITWLDDCRIPISINDRHEYGINGDEGNPTVNCYNEYKRVSYHQHHQGRFPSNLLVSDDVLNDGKVRKSIQHQVNNNNPLENSLYKGGFKPTSQSPTYSDSGSFSHYFDLDAWFHDRFKKLPKEVQKTFPFLIVTKPSKSEKDKGLGYLEESDVKFFKTHGGTGNPSSTSKTYADGRPRPPTKMKNIHPTVKSLELMSYLITLGSREGDIVLDPFVGTGTTCIAARMLSRKYMGIEIEPEYAKIAKARLKMVCNINEWL